MTLPPIIRLVLVALATITVAAGCGGSSGKAATTTAVTAEAPEYAEVPDAAVTKGLAATKAAMAALAADPATVTDSAIEALFNGWYAYEGTVKVKEVELYLTFEDALAAFKTAAKAKDTAGMATAQQAFAATAATYLAKHP